MFCAGLVLCYAVLSSYCCAGLMFRFVWSIWSCAVLCWCCVVLVLCCAGALLCWCCAVLGCAVLGWCCSHRYALVPCLLVLG